MNDNLAGVARAPASVFSFLPAGDLWLVMHTVEFTCIQSVFYLFSHPSNELIINDYHVFVLLANVISQAC